MASVLDRLRFQNGSLSPPTAICQNLPRLRPCERDPNPGGGVVMKTIAALAGLAAALFTGQATAQAFPSKAVHIIVPFPGGSVTDTFTRLIGDNMAAALGQTVITEPKAGAGTEIGTKYVIAQPPDGYNILMA